MLPLQLPADCTDLDGSCLMPVDLSLMAMRIIAELTTTFVLTRRILKCGPRAETLITSAKYRGDGNGIVLD